MRKISISLAVFFSIALFSASSILAETQSSAKVNARIEGKVGTQGDVTADSAELSSGNTQEYERSDLNKDGIINSKERRLSWKYGLSAAKTDEEKRYDLNGNGWLDPDEAERMLKDKYNLIKDSGKANADSKIEAEYDTNGDGVIDANEAKALRRDLKGEGL